MTAHDFRAGWISGEGFDNDLPLTASPEHERQEEALSRLLSGLTDIYSVLDVGCGRGRIAALLQRLKPSAEYTGLDIGETQLQLTAFVRPDGSFIKLPVQELNSSYGRGRWDLVIASEVLMHIPSDEIQLAIDNLKAVTGKYLVITEWAPEVLKVPKDIAWWNIPHDYLSLLGPVSYAARTDEQVIYMWEPE